MAKEKIEGLNSLLWFAMDGFWMMKWNLMAASMFLPTLLTGLWLIHLEKRDDVRWIDISVTFWIGLNGTWLVSEVHGIPDLLWVAKTCFFLGFTSLAISLHKSSSIPFTISQFRRLRIRPNSKSQVEQ